MTREQAEYIAERVPGAEVFNYVAIPQSGVQVIDPQHQNLRAFIYPHGAMSVTTGDVQEPFDRVLRFIASIESALADARAAGILPGDGKGEDGR